MKMGLKLRQAPDQDSSAVASSKKCSNLSVGPRGPAPGTSASSERRGAALLSAQW